MHTNTYTFCKKNNGMVNNSATFSFPYLNKSYLYHFSEEAFTEHSLFKDTLSTTVFKAWSFVCKKNLGKKPKPTTKNLPCCHCDLVHSRQSCMWEEPPFECKSSGFISQLFCNTTNTSRATPPTCAHYLSPATFQNTTFGNQTECSQ